MPSLTIEHQLRDFVEFALRRIECGDDADSMEDLFRDWLAETESQEVADDVRQGQRDKALSLGVPAAEAIRAIRLQLGLPE